MPVLLLVLLLVFRSPIAAAIPLGFGALTVFASRGMLYALTSWLGIDAFALTVCTMMGLALGVDYSLLDGLPLPRGVSRRRDDPIDAAWATRRTAGRTTMFAGSTLFDLDAGRALHPCRARCSPRSPGTVTMVVVLSVARRDGRRPGAAGADRPQHRSLADRPAAERETRG